MNAIRSGTAARIFLPFFAVMLGSCGGGGGDDPAPSSSTTPPAATTPTAAGISDYVIWQDNANGSVIKDAQNTNFAVQRSTRTVMTYPSGKALTRLAVDSSGRIADAGQVIGQLQFKPAAGQKVLVLYCSNGGEMTITVTADTWRYACAQSSSGTQGGNGSVQEGTQGTNPTGGSVPTGTQGTTPTGGNGQTSGENQTDNGNTGSGTSRPLGLAARECIASSRDRNGGIALRNTCNVDVSLSWCTMGDPNVFIWHRCGRRSSPGEIFIKGTRFLSVSEAATTLAPGAIQTFAPEVTSVAYMACRGAPGYKSSTPFLTDYDTNPPLGVCTESFGEL